MVTDFRVAPAGKISSGRSQSIPCFLHNLGMAWQARGKTKSSNVYGVCRAAPAV
jgi:hypothetical protein